MAPRSVELHPAAVEEAEAAYAWYRARSLAAAAAFAAELDKAVDSVSESPDRWPAYIQGTRRYLLSRFPFYLVYQANTGMVRILAVAHARRRPGYWKTRGK